MDDNLWWLRGRCYESYDLRFFGSKQERRAVAAELCADCAVKVECAGTANLVGERHGVWGGRVGRQHF